MDDVVAEEFKKSSPYSKWDFGLGELIRSSTSITKVKRTIILSISKKLTLNQYGLYDRPELKTWHSGRVVLVGDAAHPTTPVSIYRQLEVCVYSSRILYSTSDKARTNHSRISTPLSRS